MNSDVPGWRSSEQLEWIRTLCKGRRSVLEIGTYCGRTTRALLEATDGAVFGVEPLGLPATNHEMIEANADKELWLSRLAQEYPARFVLLPALSQNVIWERPIDVLLIDGDHSFDGVLDSLERFAKHVIPGGILLIDAWGHPKKPDVLPAWEEYLDDLRQPGYWLKNGSSKFLHSWHRSQDG